MIDLFHFFGFLPAGKQGPKKVTKPACHAIRQVNQPRLVNRQAGKSRQNDGYSPFWLMRALPFSALSNKSIIPDKVSKLLCRNSMTYSIHTTHGSSLTLKLQRQRAVLFAIAHEDRRCQAYAQHSTPKKLE